MGQGDKPKKFNPSYAPIECSVSGLKFASCAIRECKEPHVVRKFGNGGSCNVSIYICRHCKFHTKTPYCGAVGCSYMEGENEQ